ncbi:hypothetical protein [Phaeacidiphilus oryzae]|uniref:hypothetical protein n=1 Tax=Phaeacidiphilus oryzae TaxID=348818 RepID=UPI00068B9ED2|nr:hypothetical protein [Phaeacidiphilus oryzae]
MASDFGADLRKLFVELSGYQIEDTDYVSYFVNEYGERLIFVQRRGESTATLLHSDLDWEPKIIDGPVKTMGDTVDAAEKAVLERVNPDGGLLNTPTVAGIILNWPEAMWLKACRDASQVLRGQG